MKCPNASLFQYCLCDKGLKKAIFESNNKIGLLCQFSFHLFFGFENISML